MPEQVFTRIHTQALPRGNDNVVALFKRVLGLSGVMKIELSASPAEFMVIRSMEEETGPVIPPAELAGGESVDPGFLLTQVKLEELAFVPGMHPYLTYLAATEKLTSLDLQITGIIAMPGFADYFGLDDLPKHFMGAKVLYHTDEKFEDKIVVLGGPTTYIADSTTGIIVDTGI